MNYIYVFIGILGMLSFLTSLHLSNSSLYYKDKSTLDMSHVEYLVKVGQATFKERASLFFFNFFKNLKNEGLTFISFLITFIYWIFA